MTDVLHGVEADVDFDDGTADALISFCTSTASTVRSQQGARRAAENTASRDFQGYFSRLFRDNCSTARADSYELADRLDEIADHARHLKACAAAEQRRREEARAWMAAREDRGWLEQRWDDVTESEEDATPPVGPPDPEPSLEASPPRQGVRLTPPPGTGGGGESGTSSANPTDLRSFATTSNGQNAVLAGEHGTLGARLASFSLDCRWGNLSATGVVSGFRSWNEANAEDVLWARTVADAFARAGSEGQVSTLANSALLATLAAGGVDATRDDLTIAPAFSYGVQPTTGYAVDPVNTATGNFLETETDLRFPGAGAGLRLERTYNSFDPVGGAFGPGWSSWTEAGLEVDAESARVTGQDGRTTVFPREGGAWATALGENRWLSRTDDGWRMSTHDGSWWDYDSSGLLVELATGPAAGRVRLERTGARLDRLVHSRGRHLALEWDEAGERVLAVVASDGRRVEYAYEDGRMVGATGPLGTRRYDHDEAGRIRTVTDADGVVELDNEYDDLGRVSRQRTQHGRLVRFAYLRGDTTVVSDPDGSRSNTWIHDHRGRLVGLVDSDEKRQSMSYDGRGNLVMTSERDGATTIYEYDGRGRRTRTVAADGGELTVGHDQLDRVVSVVSASGGVTRYEFEGEARTPSVVVDPEGGRMLLRWEDGLLTSVEDPTGVTVSMAYDDRGDLVAARDAAGGTARMERDDAGRVVATVTPGGARTEMTYDAAGLPTTRRDPDGALWRFEHSPAGRLTGVTDPLGGRTSIEQGPHGDDVRTVDPLGRSLTRTLDDLGNLASAELPDGSTWHYTHDALSRLVATVDPTGGEWRTEHDANGAVVATEDPTGRRRTVGTDRATGTVTVDDGLVSRSARVDGLGRLVASTQPDGSTALATYDRCGRVVESLDAEGGLTRIVRDAAGRPVEVVDPTGATTRVEHDACGRVSAVVDPTGARTTRSYDADGRLVRQVLPTGEVARAEHDACGRLTALWRPGHGVARYAYDLAGRLVESSDTSFGHRRFRYDAAGRLVAVTDGVGGVTRYEYDEVGRCVATTDPLGGTTRRELDALGRCVAVTDPLGRTTRAGRDAAGRTAWELDPDGVRTTWTYDQGGRWRTRSVDGALRADLHHDPRARTLALTDHADPRGPVRHVLEYDRRQQLVRRSRDDRSLAWTYDAAGRRATATAPDGTRTTYVRDAAGRLTALDHPLLGRLDLELDPAGRLVRAVAGAVSQTWDHHEGWVVGHQVTGPGGTRSTTIERDAEGRIGSVVLDGDRTTLEHDTAHQLVARRGPGSTTTWRYDAAGRLVEESVTGAGERTRSLTYDPAGQLLSSEDAGGTTTHAYDGSGRRVRTTRPDGSGRELTWSPEGWLASVTDRDGATARRTDLHVDATGELATVDGLETWWDSAGRVPGLVQAGDDHVLSAGPLTGVGRDWVTPGWRTARDTSTDDPWGLDGAVALTGTLGLGAGGELVVAGLEWMGARAYDPVDRGFLSVDPLPPVAGTPTVGNPYAFAGNDPWHALDPLGLRPVSDADLQEFGAANAGALAGAMRWVDENTDYIVGGLVTAAGVAAFFVPLPGAQIVGGMLMGAGVNIIQQRAEAGRDGQVDLVQVGIAAGFGAVGGAGTSLALRAGAGSMLRASAYGGAGTGAAEGLVSGSYDYLTGPGPHTPGGYATSVGWDVLTNTATGAAMGPVQAKIDETAMFRVLPQVRDTPDIGLDDQGRALMNAPGDVPVIGASGDVRVTAPWDGHVPLSDGPAGTAAVQQAVDYQRPVYLASGPGATSSTQMDILTDAGYSREGDYMVPGGG